jgi:hypothetical protein
MYSALLPSELRSKHWSASIVYIHVMKVREGFGVDLAQRSVFRNVCFKEMRVTGTDENCTYVCIEVPDDVHRPGVNRKLVQVQNSRWYYEHWYKLYIKTSIVYELAEVP